MRRWIIFWCSAAVLFYIAIIYQSKSFIFLGFAIAIAECLLCLHNLFVCRRLRIRLRTRHPVGRQGEDIPLELIVDNPSILPAGKVCVCVRISYLTIGKSKKIWIQTTVPGRKWLRGRRPNGVAKITWKVKAQYAGAVQLAVRRARVYDLLGVLPLPMRRKYSRAAEAVAVVPEQREARLDWEEINRQFRRSQGSSVALFGGNASTDILEIREYRPGDRLRSIHWKLSAKKEDWMVRENVAEADCQVLFFLDMGCDAKGYRRRPGRQREEMERRQEYLVRFYAVALELVHGQCPFYTVYWDQERQDMNRCIMEKEEDVERFLLQFVFREGQVDCHETQLEEIYQGKYRQPYAVAFTLYRDLRCTCNGEAVEIEKKRPKGKEGAHERKAYMDTLD